MADTEGSDSPFFPGRVWGELPEPGLQGMCVTCGFLSYNVNRIDSKDSEVSWFIRFEDSLAPVLPEDWLERLADEQPINCFLHIADIAVECATELESSGDGNRSAAFAKVLWKDRACPEWFIYCAGLGPKAHLRRYEMQRLEQDRRDFQLKLAAMSTDAQKANQSLLADSKQIAEDNKSLVAGIKTIAEQMADSSVQSDRFSKRIAWLVVALAVLQVLLAAIALTKDSLIIKWLFPGPPLQ